MSNALREERKILMDKKKKLLSLLTALTMTATAFAGLAIPANAASTSIVTYDFEDGTAWTESGSNTAQYDTKVEADATLNSKVLSTSLTNQTGGRKMTLKLPSVITPTTNVVKVDFDWLSKTTGAKDSTDTVLVGSNDVQIFDLNEDVDTGKIKFNGVDTGLATGTNGTWYKVSATLDFETKQVITVTFTKNGETTPAKTISNSSFVNSAAADIAGIYLSANRTNNISLTWKLDNFEASSITDEHYKATVNVKTSADAPVADATVKIGDATYTTDANGQVVTKLPIGEYTYTVSKAGYEATSGQEDDATGTITITNEDVVTNVTYSPQVYTAVPTTVTMAGGQKVMTAPHTANKTTSAAYTVSVIDQKNVAIDDADITWTVLPTGSETADSNVTIADGVISVANGFTAGDSHVKNFTVTATATKNGTSKSATATIDISDYLFYEPGVGGSSYATTNTASDGKETYIASPATKTTEKITFPEAVTFTAGTAQLLSFKTTVNHATGYTFKRVVSAVDSEDKSIIDLGYIDLSIGDASTAEWNSTQCSFETTWGSISAVNEWVDVSVLFKTNANGVTKVKLTVGDKEYDLGTTTATNLAGINTLLDLNTVNRYVLLKDIVVSEVDVTGMGIDGATQFSTISGKNVTKDYAVDAMVIEDGETFTWTTTIPGATITPDANDSQKAVLSVPGTTTTGGTITATSSVSTEEKSKKATIDVEVAPAQLKSATISGADSLNKTAGTATYTISDIKDQFGDDVTEYFAPVWSLETQNTESSVAFNVTAEAAGTAVAVKAQYNSDGTLKSVSTENVSLAAGENTVTIKADNGTKVMLWNALNGTDGLKPLSSEVKTVTADTSVSNATINATTGVVTITDDGDVIVKATLTNGDNEYSFTKDVKIGTYSVVDDADGDSTDVDISSLIEDANITGYQVTTATTAGALVKSVTVAKADVTDGKITVDSTGADKIEIAPVFETAMEKTITIPSDSYNVTITANNGKRTDVYVNDQMVFNNVNQGGDNWTVGRVIAASADYTANDVVISQGYAKFNYQDDASSKTTITNVKVTKSPSIVTRKTRLYVIGDSLTAKYYGDAPTGSESLVRTGWGDVLQNYMADSVEVTNLGNSGAWAEGMLNDAFTNVRESGQAGDILVLESGYNDKSHTSMDVMKDSIKAMVKGAEEKGMTVFVVTPNASSHSVSEYLGNVVSTSSVIEAVNELKADGSNAILIDLAAKSGAFFKSYYGDAAYTGDTASIPAATVTTLQTYYNNSGDSLHSSYNAANCWAAVVANGIYTNAATADFVDTTNEYTFSDGTNTITVSALQIANPNYTVYDITTADGVTSITRPTGTVITQAAAGDTVKVVISDTTKVLKVNGGDVEATYNSTTNAYYFTMPAAAVTLTIEDTTSNNDSSDSGNGSTSESGNAGNEGQSSDNPTDNSAVEGGTSDSSTSNGAADNSSSDTSNTQEQTGEQQNS
jgi:lysophospholipase L1-like esterase